MYQKYQTEAIVLGCRDRGEADRDFALYTREFGLVWARAGGVRKEASKMRHALQLYAHASVGLVRGHAGWRVAGAMVQSTETLSGSVSVQEPATPSVRLPAELASLRQSSAALTEGVAGSSHLASAALFARVAQLVLRLVAGEEQNEYLFEVLCACRNHGAVGGGEVELVTVARILYALGYLSADAFGVALFIDVSFDNSRLAEAKKIQNTLVSSINRALSETHL